MEEEKLKKDIIDLTLPVEMKVHLFMVPPSNEGGKNKDEEKKKNK